MCVLYCQTTFTHGKLMFTRKRRGPLLLFIYDGQIDNNNKNKATAISPPGFVKMQALQQ